LPFVATEKTSSPPDRPKPKATLDCSGVASDPNIRPTNDSGDLDRLTVDGGAAVGKAPSAFVAWMLARDPADLDKMLLI
jgi:hypothetical protein